MANKRNLKDPKNDFAYDEGEVSGFSNETAIVGDLIATFSVNDSSETQTLELNPVIKIDNNTNNASNSKPVTLDNDINNNNNNNNDISNNNINNNIITQTNTTDPIETKNIISPTNHIFDNRRTKLANGQTPSIDGETPAIKRTYTLRVSTIRRINELKHVHPDINVCVSSIVDIALDYYHNYILHEGGTQ